MHHVIYRPEAEPRGMVMCVHGFSTEGAIYGDLVTRLTAAGYLVRQHTGIESTGRKESVYARVSLWEHVQKERMRV